MSLLTNAIKSRFPTHKDLVTCWPSLALSYSPFPCQKGSPLSMAAFSMYKCARLQELGEINRIPFSVILDLVRTFVGYLDPRHYELKEYIDIYQIEVKELCEYLKVPFPKTDADWMSIFVTEREILGGIREPYFFPIVESVHTQNDLFLKEIERILRVD